ncbi:MAG: AMP-binding protein [Nostoc sp. NMS8]|nr:AMP-binding protein [Nostoc sp. NMS8]
MVDLQEFSQDQRSEQVQQKVKQELETLFNLTESQSLRVTLLQVAPQEFVLLASMHHIVFDGWSVAIFIQELFTLYQAFLSNSSSPLPSLPIQYADFAVWQRQWWREERLQTQLDYWKQQLSNASPILELPSDRPRPSIQSFRGKSLSFQLNPELNKQLQTLSKKTGTTLFMTLLAAFATLLYRYSSQEDISIGSPIANRNRSEIEPLIGSFVNTLVLRIRIQDNPSFAELLAQVQQVALDAYEHQDAPFEKVVEALQPERSLSHNPLFQVMFVLQNVPEQTFKLPNLTLTPFDLDNVTSKFDLTLSMAQTKQGLQGRWEYNTDLFDGDTITRMNQHFQTLLFGIVANPQLQVSKLPLLTATERQILVDWNNTQREYPKDKCIHQLFELQVEKTPLAVAVVFEDQKLTYLELNKKANCLAHYLQKLGVGPEVVVGLCVERSTDMIVGLLGILKAGGAYLPLDPALPAQNLVLRLQDVQVSVVISHTSLVDSFEQMTVICLDTDWDIITKQPDRNPIALVTPENLIYVLYTSGSTGRPNPVAIEHRQLLNYYYGIVEKLKLPTGASFATISTFAADLGNTVIFPSLGTGGCLHIISYECAIHSAALADYCDNHPIDCLKIVPTHLAALLTGTQPEKILPRQCLIMGGEAATWELIEQIRQYADCRIFNHYGPTEATVGVLTYPVQMHEGKSALVPLGYCWRNIT